MTVAAQPAHDRTAGQLPRPWDSFDAYLFDIDGTLLHCRDAVHYFAFCETLSSIAGRSLTLEGVIAHGNTDIGILRDALVLAGISDRAWRPGLPAILDGMCRCFEAREDELCIEVLPAVRRVLDRLRARGAILGVATGNLRAIGEIKLRRADLLSYFSFAGWSDSFERRADVFRAAAAQAWALAGAGASLCVIGDTPSDVRAARALGLPVIAVATGVFSAAELLAEDPELCVTSLRDLIGDNRTTAETTQP